MRVSELVTRLDEQRQRVGNVAVSSALSGKWEGREGPVVGVKTDRGRAGTPYAQEATVMVEGRVEDEDSQQAGCDTALLVSDLISRLARGQQIVGDVEVKLRVAGESPFDREIGPITEVSALRWSAKTLDGITTTNTDITILGPFER